MDAKPRETQRGCGMHRDKKVGLAMGILLVGIVAAFFFRNESDPLEDIPLLEDALALDEQIATESGGPYLTGLEPVDERYRNSGTIPSTEPLPTGNATDASTVQLESPVPIDTFAPVVRIEPVTNSKPAKIAVPVGSPFETARDESQDVFSEDIGWESVADIEPILPDIAAPITNASESRDVPPKTNRITVVSPPLESPIKAVVEQDTKPVLTKPPARERTYRIRPGDTLSEIAWRELGSSRRFHELYEANRDRLSHPDNLPIGMELRIPTVETNEKGSQSVPTETKTPSVQQTTSRRFLPSHQSPFR